MAMKLPSVVSPSVTALATVMSFVFYTHMLNPHAGSALKSDISMICKEMDSINQDVDALRSIVGKLREDLGEIKGKTNIKMATNDPRKKYFAYAQDGFFWGFGVPIE